ncbi:MAG: hypothetical protein LBG72_06655 [Spirochaetaceae bacterium]|jgi:hypothetical protein|nr:hypothetical protein [Spirochaetaceae bacterium]
MPANCKRRFVFLCVSFMLASRVSAQTGFYTDLAFQYVSNTLNSIAKDKVQGAEPALNFSFRFFDRIGVGVSTNFSLGFYSIYGSLSGYSLNPPFYTTKDVKEYPIYRFDIQPYIFLSFPVTSWVEFGIGAGPEISIYQYMFNSYHEETNGEGTSRELIGTQAIGLGLMPQVQFTIYERIVFGIRFHIVPVTFSGRTVYVYHYENEKLMGYDSFEKEGYDIQNTIFKFAIFGGYRFGRARYRSNYEY